MKFLLDKIEKKYIIFGGAIVASRALEYFVLLFSANYLDKDTYGQLEFYKKIIEVASVFFAFGFPALILSYTKSERSKDYFYLLSLCFVCVLTVCILPVIHIYNLYFLIIPFLFYAIFFNGGITPTYLLVKKGSNYASKYKIIISCLFYIVLFVGIYKFQFNGKAYLKTSYLAFMFFISYLIYKILNLEINLYHTKKYFKLFRKLLISSSTLVISNFANMMFLYTDIFVLSQVSSNSNQEIADFSFALNISSMLLLIPLTLVQVDVEKLKKSKLQFNILNKKINNLLSIVLLVLLITYIILIKYFIVKYDNTLSIFIVLLIAKYFHAKSSLYGTYMLILKKFNTNLLINFLALLLNIIACYYSYTFLGILGLSISSLILLLLRFLILKMFKNYFSNKTLSEINVFKG